jgi:hypothetical protein
VDAVNVSPPKEKNGPSPRHPRQLTIHLRINHPLMYMRDDYGHEPLFDVGMRVSGLPCPTVRFSCLPVVEPSATNKRMSSHDSGDKHGQPNSRRDADHQHTLNRLASVSRKLVLGAFWCMIRRLP